MKRITFYHSVICPRCRMAARSLAKLHDEFSDIRVERVEYLANLGQARRAGVRAIPSLVAADRSLSGFYLTRERIRRFLASL